MPEPSGETDRHAPGRGAPADHLGAHRPRQRLADAERLGAYPRQNGLALGLREISRIERTLFILNWPERPDLRRQATAEPNKGEAHNALARAGCFHRFGWLRDRTAELQPPPYGATPVCSSFNAKCETA